jgi:hypothetical protein
VPKLKLKFLENNNFSKEYWGTTCGGGESNGGSGNQASYWMVDNEKRYRQEVFQRNCKKIHKNLILCKIRFLRKKFNF